MWDIIQLSGQNVCLLVLFWSTTVLPPTINTQLTKATLTRHLHIPKRYPEISSALTLFTTCSLEISVPGSLSVCQCAQVSQHVYTSFPIPSQQSQSPPTSSTLVLSLSNSAIYQTSFPQHNSNTTHFWLQAHKVRFISKCQIWQVNSMRPHSLKRPCNYLTQGKTTQLLWHGAPCSDDRSGYLLYTHTNMNVRIPARWLKRCWHISLSWEQNFWKWSPSRTFQDAPSGPLPHLQG